MPSDRATRLAELRALRASGKKRGSTYEVEDLGDIYDEVDDDGYKKVIRSRLDEDDFVVDDNGAGYADDGREVWNETVVDYSSDDSDELPARGKAAKRKREEEQQRKEKMNNGISRYFNNAHAAAAAPKSKVSWCPVCTVQSRGFCLTIALLAYCYCRRQGLYGGSSRGSRLECRVQSRSHTEHRQV